MSTRHTLTVRQAAMKLGNTQKYVRDLLYEGRLPGATKVGRAWAIPASAVEAHLKARQQVNHGSNDGTPCLQR